MLYEHLKQRFDALINPSANIKDFDFKHLDGGH